MRTEVASASGNNPQESKARPTTRASLRSTLNLALVGKALSDVISKDGKDSAKVARKTKDTGSRRLSAIQPKASAPRPSTGDASKPSATPPQSAGTATGAVAPTSAPAAGITPPAAGSASAPANSGSTRPATPESRTIKARRRLSASANPKPSTDDPAPKSSIESNIPMAQSAVPPAPRIATLRPRANGATVVPKYRPKSQIGAPGAAAPPAQAPSPTPPVKSNSPTPTKASAGATSPIRPGHRRTLTSSSEECKEDKPVSGSSPGKKSPRPVSPVSPLQQRAALKAVGNSPRTPTAPTTKPKAPISPPNSSPTRPRTQKVATPQHTPRPSSSSSSSSPATPRTPKTPSINGSVSSRSGSGMSASPTTRFPAININARTESPLAPYPRRSSRQHSLSSSSTSSLSGQEMARISEGNSESDDEEQVRMLLEPESRSSVNNSPVVPRITRMRSKNDPHTPPARNFLPTRANLGYLAPMPPDGDRAPSLRPTALTRSGERAARGSILSWEQLAQEASKSLGDDADIVLSEVAAPFRSGAVSPALSNIHLEIPESPCLSTLSTPSGYGSISQVLLPDVTPSPAMRPSVQSRYDEAAQSAPAVDGAIVTLLKLQLASAENMAKERLYQMQTMEEELHRLKEARSREVQELTQQVVIMEEQVKQNLESRIKATEERVAYTASLEDQLKHAQAYKEEAVREAVKQAKEEAKGIFEKRVKRQQQSWELTCSASRACSEWEAVKQVSADELELVRADKEVLAVFMNELNHLQVMMLAQ